VEHDDLEETELRFVDEDMEELFDLEELDALDLSLKWVSRCCFILSARVNFLWQPANVHWTAFSAVWILE
jgi:hypothetical protein